MTFRRWPHGIVTLILLCVAVLILVSFETGSAAHSVASSSGAARQPLETRGPTGPGTELGPSVPPTGRAGVKPPGGSSGAANQAATGSDGSVAAGDGPGAGHVAMNPFNFRLGLINGTIVQPDARDWAARTVSTGPLLLFLPATGHVPDDYTRFLTVAAESGYHVLGLDFWNQGHAVANICGVDAECYTQVQRNRFNGTQPNRFSKVDEANSVLSRMEAALSYLAKHDPQGGWNQYQKNGQIDWADIVVSGHSQGGGEAAYIAHENRVFGQLTFSSPIITDRDISASWLKTKGQTPTSVMFAFDDVHDEFYPRIVKSWRELHLPGTTIRARVPVPSSGDTVHRLVSTFDLGNPEQSHLRSVTDFTPLDAKGTPVFEPVWTYLLGQIYNDPMSIASAQAKE